METRAWFDQKADTYDDFCLTPLGHYVDMVEHEVMAAVARPERGEKAIDLGCGTGSYAYWLNDRALSAVGVDISPNMLAVARRKQKQGVSFVQADLSSLPFDDNTFDLAICNAVLEFTDDPASILVEGFRVVKPGGRLVVGCINKRGAWGKKYAKRGQEDPTSIYRHAQFFTLEDVSKMRQREPAEARFGLCVGPDEFQNFRHAMQLERQFEGPHQDAGYFVVRWDK